jgi:hypothetical protein
MDAKELEEFRSVGSTALNLHLGHQMTEDIDFFTYAEYRFVDFDQLVATLFLALVL